MKALRVEAHLRGAIAERSKSLMLDSLLMAAVATRDGLDPLPPWHRGPTDLPIPIAKSDCERVFLCSQGFAKDEVHELRYKNRRFPIFEAQLIGEPKLKRINITGGPCRSYRIPLDTVHLEGNVITWWCVGQPEPLRELLTCWVGYLGHRRAVGLGRVLRWDVEECEDWDGFPVLLDGRPLRPLPTDWDGLIPGGETAMGCLLPPYWRRTEQEIVAVPC